MAARCEISDPAELLGVLGDVAAGLAAAGGPA
jgi:hypothetical protein